MPDWITGNYYRRSSELAGLFIWTPEWYILSILTMIIYWFGRSRESLGSYYFYCSFSWCFARLWNHLEIHGIRISAQSCYWLRWQFAVLWSCHFLAIPAPDILSCCSWWSGLPWFTFCRRMIHGQSQFIQNGTGRFIWYASFCPELHW